MPELFKLTARTTGHAAKTSAAMLVFLMAARAAYPAARAYCRDFLQPMAFNEQSLI